MHQEGGTAVTGEQSVMAEDARLTFEPLRQYQRGILERLLTESYAAWDVAQNRRAAFEARWRQADRDSFDHLDTIGRCVFVTCLNGCPIGFGCFDPRQAPERGLVGHNCIVTRCRGRGYGRRQLEELLRRLRELDIRRAVATTGEHPFFAPAQRMYLRCGFRETRRYDRGADSPFRVIECEKDLTQS